MSSIVPRVAFALAALLSLPLVGCASSSSVDEKSGFLPLQERAKPAVDPATIPCPLMADDEAFLAAVLRGYRDALRTAGLKERPLPWTVVMGKDCVYQLAPRGPLEGGKYLTTGLMWNASPVVVHGAGHAGEVTLPNGVRAGRDAYRTTLEWADDAIFLLSLPELWPRPAEADADVMTLFIEEAVVELMLLATSQQRSALFDN